MTCEAKDGPCTFTTIPLESVNVIWGGPAVGRKAVAFPARRTIYIDPAFWKSLRTTDARAAILAHERGHLEGARCESCADRRAGEILAREGTPTPRDAARALAGRLENRNGDKAMSDFLDGFGLDEVQGPGYMLNAERADGVEKPLRDFLAKLHREGLFYNGVTYSLTVGVQGGVRTDAEQLALYMKGREWRDGKWVIVNPGAVVTNAMTTGQSKHGQHKAVDVWVMLPSGQPLLYPSQAPGIFEGVYAALGAKGEAFGLRWGGRFKLASGPDRPHFEIPDGGYMGPALASGAVLFFLTLAVLKVIS